MCKTFGDNDLKITMQANITVVNFLDITLDLKSGKHWPSLNQEMFLRTFKWNPTILQQYWVEGINKRLSEISSDEECFDKAKPLYQDMLNKSGYNYKIQIELHQRTANTKKPTQEHHMV